MAKVFTLVSVQEADERLAQACLTLGTERLPLGKELLGRRLALPIYADRDFPPYNRSTMDGYAVCTSDMNCDDDVEFTVTGEQFAGDRPIEATLQDTAIRVMTGAMLDESLNAVIPKEYTLPTGKNSFRITSKVKAGQYIHFKGSDAKAGSLLILRDTMLDATSLAVVATVGIRELEVYCFPRIMLLTTGDEVVAHDATPREEQIRSSNDIMIEALLHQNGLACTHLHCGDDRAALQDQLREFLNNYDLLITTGGVSQGDKDYLPELFEEAGLTAHFHGIRQRPGKPLWFGQNVNSQTVFGLPGNPLSAHLCMVRYVLPWIRKQLSGSRLPRWIHTKCAVDNPLPLTRFLPAIVSACGKSGQLLATVLTPNTSGDMMSIHGPHGWVELPPETTFAAGAQLLLHEST